MTAYPKPNSKYKNVRQTYKSFSYDSMAEANFAAYLDNRLKKKEIKNWERQKKIELFGENGTRICNYYIDFVVTELDDSITYIEVKGFKTAVWEIKRKLLEDKLKTVSNARYEIIYV